MAFYGCFIGTLIWHAVNKKGFSRRRITAASVSVLGCILTLQLGVFSMTLETLAARDQWMNRVHPLVKFILTIGYIVVAVSFPKIASRAYVKLDISDVKQILLSCR